MKSNRFVYPERTLTSIHIRNFNEAVAPPLKRQFLIVLRTLVQVARLFFKAPRLFTEEYKAKKGGLHRERL